MSDIGAEQTEAIIGAAIEVHRELGPGLLESAFQQCLCRELFLRDIPFESQLELPVNYKGVHIDCGYRLDILAFGEVIIELKAVEKILPVHKAQLLTYLKLSEKRVGLLLNFNTPLLKDGIVRMVL